MKTNVPEAQTKWHKLEDVTQIFVTVVGVSIPLVGVTQKVYPINPFTPKISSVILLTICHTILMMLVLRICYWIN